MDKRTWTLVVALCSIAAVYVLFIRKTDEDKIRGQLEALSKAVHKSEGENDMLRAVRVEGAFSHVFTREVELRIPEIKEGRRPRHELATLAIAAGRDASAIDLKFSQVHVEIDRPMSRGWVTASAAVFGNMRNGGGAQESREVVIRFDKEEDEWKIASVALPGAGER
jgi:hypothetical protein